MNNTDPLQRTKEIAPILALPTFFVLGLALQFKALKGFYSNMDSAGYINKADWLPANEGTTFNPMLEGAWIPMNALLAALAIGGLASLILWFVLRRYKFEEEGYEGVERVFIWLQIITACYVAFAHGANDVANAIGPMAAIFDIATSATGTLSLDKVGVPIGLLLLGGAGITIGVATWGYKVMDTIGKKITHITPSRGFAAEFGAATTVLIFSMPFLAVPISTTHTLVGAVVGVGLAGGAAAVDFRVFGKIAASWIASLPVAGIGSVTFLILFNSNPTNVVIVTLLSIGITLLVVMKPEIITSTQSFVISDTPGRALSSADGESSTTPFELFHDHAVAVEKTVFAMLDAVSTAVSGEDPSEQIRLTAEAELEADKLKNTVRAEIGANVRMAIGRNTFLAMVSKQDRIADYAQNVAEQLSFRKLYKNKEAQEKLVIMAHAVLATVQKYEETVEQLENLSVSGFTRKEKDVLGELIAEVNQLEHEADEIERDAAGFVFTHGDDEALAAMHMYRVLQRLDDVANACEDAANSFIPIVYS
jgi:predicted phosphate transport protein (TIGR00153 family)